MGKRSYAVIMNTFMLISLLSLPASDIIQNAEAEAPWENILSISKIVEIPPGEEYFAYFDIEQGTIVEMVLPSLEAGLTQKAKDSLDQVPDWLYEDLAKKFAELGDTAIDVGDFASPVFADMDNDGDLDLSCGSQDEALYYFENVGTRHRPVFTINNDMYSYLNTEYLSSLGRTALAIADMDADLDNDIIVGYDLGAVIYFENIGSPTQAIWGPHEVISVAQVDGNSHPSLADLDSDGDFDLAVGAADGQITFYENIGTPESAEWEFDYFLNTGEEDDRPISFADMDDDGDFDLSVGDGDLATLYFYRNIGSSTQAFWAEDLTYYNGINPEYGTAPCIADMNGDSRPDLLVGGQSGMIFFYMNSGTASNADWLIWSSYQVAEGYNYYPKELMVNYRTEYHMDRYADLILNSAQKYKDEIGFSIAHIPLENLKAMSLNQSQLLVDNAQLIYEVDSYLDYVEVIEKGDYTTTRYNFGEVGNITVRELPRDIYYWYLVHPKITDEEVFYIHPNSGNPTDPAQGGRFWREYLFYHADESYPADNSGDPNDGVDDYPVPEVNPPLLKDLLEDVKVLFNGTTWFAPGGNYSSFKETGLDNRRPFTYGEHAIIRVSNWVGKTLILNQQEVSDSERPIQPVRIAHHHNGNCGELQDLSTAAARTVLIPAAGVLLLGEDHVWIEFYEDGWHQWDNYWSDGGSVLDMFNNYWVGWGERGGSGIMKQGGDDDTWEVTDHYIPEEDLNYVTIRVLDNNGDPVDGARVLVISYWLKVNIEGYQVEIPFPCIWNYTDSDGKTLFKLATQERANGNHNFTFKIISKVGSTESGKIELEHGEDYAFTFFLEGSAPNPQLDTDVQSNPNPPDPRYRLEVSYEVTKGVQRPRNLLTGNYHSEEIPPEEHPENPIEDFTANHIDSFITTQGEFDNFLKGYNFDSYKFQENANSDAFEFDLPDDGNWYFVLSNRDSIETTKVVELILDLYYNPPPHTVKIVNPSEGSQLNAGDIITISGLVTNESELVSLELSTDSGSNWISLSSTDNKWTYYWDTDSLDLGPYTIEVKADFGSTQSSDTIQIELVDLEPPSIEILNPLEYHQINIGQSILISGTASDNIDISMLQISTDGGESYTDILSTLSNDQWSYNWETSGLALEDYVIQILASDGINRKLVSSWEAIELSDLEPPSISISNPLTDSKIDVGTTITIRGDASDNVEIVSLKLSIDGGQNWLDILSSLDDTSWSYEWNTTSLSLGHHTLMVNASDDAYNSSYSITVELVDSEKPYIAITNPSSDSQIDVGSTITISGDATDNIGIFELELSLNGGQTWEDIISHLSNGQWSYDWDTSGSSLGTKTIKVKAEDEHGQESSDYIFIELVDTSGPFITITSPPQNEDFDCGDTIIITGTATDNMEISELELSTDSQDTWIDVLSNLDDGDWTYIWETLGLPVGGYSITVTALDGEGNQVVLSVDINLVDREMPELEITAMGEDNVFDIGDTVLIEGKASDNVHITELHISTDNGRTWTDILDNLDDDGEWSYTWDTTDEDSGWHDILIKISDGTYEVEDSISIVLIGEEDESEGISFMLLLLLILAAIAIIIVMVLFAVIYKRGQK